MKTKHKTVLLQEAVDSLNIKPRGTYIDVTLGGGGHSLEILKQMDYQGKLIAFDLDAEAIKRFEALLIENNIKNENLEVIIVNDNFIELESVLLKNKITKVDGILADLGLSTDQYLDSNIGISFLENSELDMRIDKTKQVKAKDLLNGLYEKELIKLFEDLADIKFAKQLAREIVQYRKDKSIETTKDLKAIVQKVVPFSYRKGVQRNPEAKVFQALRIAVNDELLNLRSLLPLAFETLDFGGRLAVISFHSGEDRIVKNFFREKKDNNKIEYVFKLLTPSEEEQKANPRSSSAKLRVVEKILK
ncbi:16S rRNA (cytosine(1402)-N(4))-methyltransferase RsmH [Candidatus Dojkabacteria bacterium]|uniref:Ribosomal RNA small subunit methyltransferase H n=1 Tax=Candidatus Dojkabacteria bacterium TaxID=2099670 RepID=A0A955RJA2_9BACT|nr:16S rRNA (cytosine(1402)-N(4))-methyltransferase RsmH [Candidatus Dojkabacteria bacterium]